MRKGKHIVVGNFGKNVPYVIGLVEMHAKNSRAMQKKKIIQNHEVNNKLITYSTIEQHQIAGSFIL